MEPKNIVERKKTFWSFLLLFVLSTAVIVLLAFSSTRVPIKDNALLQKEVAELDQEREFSKKFMAQMRTITSFLDSINNVDTKADLLDVEITGKINALSGTVESDSVYNKALYTRIVYNLKEMQNDKAKLRNRTESTTDNSDCKKKLEDCKKERDDWHAKYLESLANRARN